jgi:hypothetical protein
VLSQFDKNSPHIEQPASASHPAVLPWSKPDRIPQAIEDCVKNHKDCVKSSYKARKGCLKAKSIGPHLVGRAAIP